MPDLAKIAAIETKLGGAEPASDPTTAPPDGGSGTGSAPSAGDTATSDGASTGGATIDHAAMQRKLEADRERRAAKARRKQIDDDAAAAKKAREEAEADRKAAADQKAKLGKDVSWKEHLEALGKTPAQVFEEMRQEALKAGTPEAKLEAMDRAWETKLKALEEKLETTEKAREDERKQREEVEKKTSTERQELEFRSDFQTGMGDEQYAPLLEEYEPAQLFRIVDTLRKNPPHLFEQAKKLQVTLTNDDDSFTMIDILNVCLAEQRRHQAYQEEQRRKKSAAPNTSQGGPKQPPSAKPTVNGTTAKAGSSLGNQLATDRAGEAGPPPRETKAERLKRLGEKYG